VIIQYDELKFVYLLNYCLHMMIKISSVFPHLHCSNALHYGRLKARAMEEYGAKQ
jgi:hypothetical protein